MKLPAIGWPSVDTQQISADTRTVRFDVLAFARVREIVASSRISMDLARGATLRDCWAALLERYPSLAPLQSSTRIARNGRVASLDSLIEDGDEIALLPPVGGG